MADYAAEGFRDDLFDTIAEWAPDFGVASVRKGPTIDEHLNDKYSIAVEFDDGDAYTVTVERQ